jgi:erythromycin esterase
MNRWTSAVAAAAALASLALAPAARAAPPTNLLENGGFEKGLDGWKVENETGKLTASLDTKMKAEGKQSAHLVKPGATQIANDRLTIELTKLPAGKTVVVSAKLAGKGLQNTWLKFFVFDAKGEAIVEDCDIGRYTGSFNWRDVDQKFELPKEAVRAELRLCMFLGGEAWLDDVRVTGATAAAVTSGDAAKPLDPATRKWLDENSVRLGTLDAKAAFDDLAPLKAVLKDARIVQLGENTHGDGACFETKARLVRFLHEEMGFEVLAFESGLWECDRANALLVKGDAEGAMKSAVFGIWHTAPVRALFGYLAAEAKTEKPIVLAGFDCRRSGRGAATFLDDLAAFLADDAKVADADLAAMKELAALLEKQGDEYRPDAKELDAAMAAWDRVRKGLDAARGKLVARHGEAETAFVSRCLDVWKDDDAFERSKSDKSLGYWGPSNLRDAQMAANLRWLAETRYPGKKIVTWGATMHLSHGIAGIDAKGIDYKDYRNMGQGVHEAFGPACYTVGFAAWGGQCGSFGRKNPIAAPKDGSFEDVLHRYVAPAKPAPAAVFVDLRREGPFAKPTALGVLGYARDMTAKWGEVVDGVVFIDEMTPAR